MSTETNPTEPALSSAPAPDSAGSTSSAAEPGPTQSMPGATAHGRRFKHRELELADGGKLILRADGSIAQVDAAGIQAQTWEPADPDWASHAIRFGLFPQDATVAPSGRFMDDRRPPRR